MSKKKVAQTSIDTYRSLDIVKIHKTHKDIVRALENIGKGNFESIAEWLGVPETRIWRRLSECVKANLIHNTGEIKTTKSRKPSFMFSVGPSTHELETKKRVMKGKSVADHSRAISKLKETINEQRII